MLLFNNVEAGVFEMVEQLIEILHGIFGDILTIEFGCHEIDDPIYFSCQLVEALLINDIVHATNFPPMLRLTQAVDGSGFERVWNLKVGYFAHAAGIFVAVGAQIVAGDNKGLALMYEFINTTRDLIG